MNELGFTEVGSYFKEDYSRIMPTNEGVRYREWEKQLPNGKLVAIEIVEVERFKDRPISMSVCFVPNPSAS